MISAFLKYKSAFYLLPCSNCWNYFYLVKSNMKSRMLLSVLLLFPGLGGMLNAQTWVAGQNVTLNVNDYALIATNNATVSMNMTTSTAGNSVAQTSNNSLYVKISSIVPSGQRRLITARISNGTVPAGTTLTIQSASCTTAHSGGTRGYAWPFATTLSTSDQFLVWGIGTCYTGTGSTDGYRMTFTWKLNNNADYSAISSGTYVITVVFTLTEAN